MDAWQADEEWGAEREQWERDLSIELLEQELDREEWSLYELDQEECFDSS